MKKEFNYETLRKEKKEIIKIPKFIEPNPIAVVAPGAARVFGPRIPTGTE